MSVVKLPPHRAFVLSSFATVRLVVRTEQNPQIMRITPLCAALALVTGLSAPTARAQVVLSEVDFKAGQQSVEIMNRGPGEVDLSAWTVYAETRTPGKPQTYFFGFPKDTKLKSNEFILLHWFQDIKTTQKCKVGNGWEIWTGKSVFHFLFGLGGEALDSRVGALGLFNSQTSSDMNKAAFIQDWVSWGSTGFKRESLAIANNKWVKDSFAPGQTLVGPKDPSLAYMYTNLNAPSNGFNDWFLDQVPTPCADNTNGALLKTIGKGCKGTRATTPVLGANGIPKRGVNGGKDYERFSMLTTGVGQGDFVFWLIGSKEASIDIGFLIPGCRIFLTPIILVAPVPVVGNSAVLSFAQFPTQLLVSLDLYNQMLVFDTKSQLSLSNGLRTLFSK